MATYPPPPESSFYILSYPSPYTILITFNRPASLNCVSTLTSYELDALFAWYDANPGLRCAIVTGAGRAFCAGADLKEWNQSNQKSQPGNSVAGRPMAASGFAGLSRRMGKKPVIAAVNGIAFGGGMEAVTNTDIVVAAKSAKFGLPEVKRGVVAIAGALPRIVRTVGRQRAMEMALTGRPLTADEGREWGFVNYVTEDYPVDKPVEERPVVKKAIELAKEICENSPDSVIISRAGIIQGWEDGSAEHGSQNIIEVWSRRLNEGDNIKEGVLAFVEKRQPRWRDSKL
jgi:enoyl-CoA hydratase/carnithine racemase